MSSASEINALHNQAMDAADRAFHAGMHGDYTTAETLFQEAFRVERQAIMLLTERLVAISLAGNPPAPLSNKLRNLLEEAD